MFQTSLSHPLNTVQDKNESSMQKDIYCVRTIDSPVGRLTLVSNQRALCSLEWGECSSFKKSPLLSSHVECDAVLDLAERQLKEYFSGDRLVFDIPLAPSGTDFQQKVWAELVKIPYGQTITYGQQASRLGNPNASRAVGAANGKNPIGIIVPCHRVIGASGHLVGFAGGLDIKRQLLSLESRVH